jgi:putative FmdB family regulatory protein
MPIYEYRCNDCGHKLEALQKLSDAPLLACPACGKDTLTKLVSAAGFQLKGSGWYATDFKGSGGKPADKPAAENGGDSKAGDGKTAATPPSGGESKAEAKGGAQPASTPAATSASAPSAPATGSSNGSA